MIPAVADFNSHLFCLIGHFELKWPTYRSPATIKWTIIEHISLEPVNNFTTFENAIYLSPSEN
jgi:hypothetical protein